MKGWKLIFYNYISNRQVLKYEKILHNIFINGSNNVLRIQNDRDLRY